VELLTVVPRYDTVVRMRRRHHATLQAIFSRPTPANIAWDDVVSLLKGLGATIDEGREGSRVGVALNGRAAIIHRPHPQKEVKRTSVRDIRGFLEEAGVTP
jgi:hypothetical protein